MTPDAFRDCLRIIGWSQRQLAEYLGVHHTTAQRWATGAAPVPDNVAEWLVLRAKDDRRHAYPIGWEKK